MFIKYITLSFILISAFLTCTTAQGSAAIAKDDIIDYDGILFAEGLRKDIFSNDQKRYGLQIKIGGYQGAGRTLVFINTWPDYENGANKNNAFETYVYDQWSRGDHIVLIRYPGLGYEGAQGPFWKAVNLTRNDSSIVVELTSQFFCP